MEPDKFEKHIKSRLDERKINPSVGSWDKISSQLQATEASKTNTYFWYGIAATFIGVLFVSAFYFNKTDESIDSEVQIVRTPNENIHIPDDRNELIEQYTEDQETFNTQIVDMTEVKEAKKKVRNAIRDDPQNAITDPAKMEFAKNGIIANTKEQLMDAKIAEVVAQVNLLENSNLPVSDFEVDSLLRKAQREVLADKVFNKEGRVDAIALLNEVEGELDQTFRAQIFETLKEGFLKVRTAVADRNN